MTIELDQIAGPDGGEPSSRLAKYWLDQINSVRDNTQMKRWKKRGEDIVSRYRDERVKSTDSDWSQRRYNSLWSNVEILQPALYGRCPLPVVERRFKDRDPTGRGASAILERALRNEIEICNFNDAMEAAVQDYLLPGRGTTWVRYEPEFAESISLPSEPQVDVVDPSNRTNAGRGLGDDEDQANPRDPEASDDEAPEAPDEAEKQGEEEKLEDTGDRVIRESTPVDFVSCDDFITFPVRARKWTEVTAVGKRVYLSRGQAIKRFGKTIGRAVPLEKDSRGDRTQNTTLQASDQDKAQIWEIWSKTDMTVYWVCTGYDYLCDRKDDPLQLENFFPCPKPLYANSTNNTLVPVPDYIQYQDQAQQIDELTQRIYMLTKACKAAGVYNAAAKDIQRLLSESVENALIPVDDWAAFADKDGVKGQISWLPIEVVIQVINQLMVCKNLQIEEMDRLTGITDIMRGTTDARETLGGQRLKSNSSGTRLSKRQNEVARFARDTIKIMADIMCQHFSPQSLIEASGALYEEGLGPDEMPSFGLLDAARNAPQQAQGAAQAQVPPSTALGTLPPTIQGQPGPAAPNAGGNVLPFKPQPQPQPGMMPGMPPGMPPSPPQMGAGAPMGQGPAPLPPELEAKLKAVKRIADAISLLRNEKLRGFRVDIEVDSTIYPDAAQERDDRNTFVIGVTGYLKQSMELGGQLPEAIPLLGKLLQFGVRGHRIGRDLETAIEDFVDVAGEAAKRRLLQAQNNPNPEAIKAQVEMEKAKSAIPAQQLKHQVEAMKAQATIQSMQMDAQTQEKAAQAEISRQQIENQGEQANAQIDLEAKRMEMKIREMELQVEILKLNLEKERIEYERAHPEPVAQTPNQVA